MAIETGKEIIARANTRAEIGAVHLTDADINKLNNNRRGLIELLGFDVGENWENSIPIRNLTANRNNRRSSWGQHYQGCEEQLSYRSGRAEK